MSVTLTMHAPGVLRIDASSRDATAIRLVPGLRANARAEPPYWTGPATLYHGVLLRNIFGADLTYGKEVATHFRKEREAEAARVAAVSGQAHAEGHDPRLYGYQKTGSSRFLIPGGAALADEVGTGKTPTSLQALEIVGPDSLPALVVTTRTMKLKWAAEMGEWGPRFGTPYVVSGSKAQRVKILAAAAADPCAVVLINWEALQGFTRLAHYPGQELTEKDKQLKELNAIPFSTVILDEAHRIKDPHAKTTRATWWLGQGAKRRWTLTGTPVGNDYVDIWSLLHFLEPTVWPDRSHFLDRYVVSISNGFRDEPLFLRPEHKAELFWWLDQYMLRRTVAELPELASAVPKVRDIRLDVELEPDQAKLYKQFVKASLSKVEGGLLVATDPLVKNGRLREIAQAIPVMADGEVSHYEMPSNKIKGLLELIEDPGLRPMVAFAESAKLIRLAGAELERKGYRVGYITGEENDAQRAAHIADFQQGNLDALLATAAGGEGITLTAGASMVFLQMPRSQIQLTQMRGRVPRIGNSRPLIPCYYLVSAGTVDEDTYDQIVVKRSKLEDIVRDGQRLGALNAAEAQAV